MNRGLLLESGEALPSVTVCWRLRSRPLGEPFDPFQLELATTSGRTAPVTLEVVP